MEKRIIEIDGVKLEIDLREVKQIDTYKVGDNVKVWDLDSGYSSGDKFYSGVITNFYNFDDLPTIEVMTIKEGYSEITLEFIYISKNTSDRYKLVPATEEVFMLEGSSVIKTMDRVIQKKQNELQEAINKKEFFIKKFGKAFGAEKAELIQGGENGQGQ